MTTVEASFASFDLLADRRTQVALAAGSALVLAVVTAAHITGNIEESGLPVAYGRVLAVELLQWGIWAATVPAIAAIERTRGVRVLGWGRGLLVHLVWALGFALVANAIMAPIVLALGFPTDRDLPGFVISRVIAKLPESLGIYALIAGVCWLVTLAQDRATHAMRAAKLERDLTEARLLALQAQLQPHFLFNTLNLLAGLVRQGRNDVAVETIAELSDLLRRSLDSRDRPEVTLEEELDWLRRYLSIQKKRFGELLTADEAIDPMALGVMVPPFLLQPLVENAVMHGLRHAGGGRIVISARLDGEQLVIDIEDDGSGVPVDATEGIGLGLTRDRLATRFGARASLRLSARETQGTIVRVIIPAPHG